VSLVVTDGVVVVVSVENSLVLRVEVRFAGCAAVVSFGPGMQAAKQFLTS